MKMDDDKDSSKDHEIDRCSSGKTEDMETVHLINDNLSSVCSTNLGKYSNNYDSGANIPTRDQEDEDEMETDKELPVKTKTPTSPNGKDCLSRDQLPLKSKHVPSTSTFSVNKIIKPDPDANIHNNADTSDDNQSPVEDTAFNRNKESPNITDDDVSNRYNIFGRLPFYDSSFLEKFHQNSKQLAEHFSRINRTMLFDPFAAYFNAENRNALAKLSEMFAGKIKDANSLSKPYTEKLLDNSQVKDRNNFFPFTSYSRDTNSAEITNLNMSTGLKQSNSVDPDMIPIKYEGNFDGQNCVRKLESLVASMSKRSKINSTARSNDTIRLVTSSASSSSATATGKDQMHVYNSSNNSVSSYLQNQNKSHRYLYPYSVDALTTTNHSIDAPLDLSVKKNRNEDSSSSIASLEYLSSSAKSNNILASSYSSYRTPSLYLSESVAGGGSSLASLEKKFGENSKILDWVGSTQRPTNTLLSTFAETNIDKTTTTNTSTAYSSLCGMMLNDFGVSPPPLAKSKHFPTTNESYYNKTSPLLTKNNKEVSQAQNLVKPIHVPSKEKDFRLYPIIGNWPTKHPSGLNNGANNNNNNACSSNNNTSTNSSVINTNTHHGSKKRNNSAISPNSPKNSDNGKSETGFRLVRGQDAWMRSGYEQAEQILRCLECNTSFDSLPKLTVHMIQTAHYLNLARHDKLMKNNSSLISSINSSANTTTANAVGDSTGKLGMQSPLSSSNVSVSSQYFDLKNSDEKEPVKKTSDSPKDNSNVDNNNSMKFIKQELTTTDETVAIESPDETLRTSIDSSMNNKNNNQIPQLKKVFHSDDFDSCSNDSPPAKEMESKQINSFSEDNVKPPKLEPIQPVPENNCSSTQSSRPNLSPTPGNNDSSSALKAMQSFINRSFGSKVSSIHTFSTNHMITPVATSTPSFSQTTDNNVNISHSNNNNNNSNNINSQSSSNVKNVLPSYSNNSKSISRDDQMIRKASKRRQSNDNTSSSSAGRCASKQQLSTSSSRLSSNTLKDDDAVNSSKKIKYSNASDTLNFYSSMLKNDQVSGSLMSRLADMVSATRKDKTSKSHYSSNDLLSHWDGSMTATEAEFNGLLAARIQGMNLDSFLRNVVEHISKDNKGSGDAKTQEPLLKSRSSTASLSSSSSSSSPIVDDRQNAQNKSPYLQAATSNDKPSFDYSLKNSPSHQTRVYVSNSSSSSGGINTRSQNNQQSRKDTSTPGVLSSGTANNSCNSRATSKAAVVISHKCSTGDSNSDDKDARKPIPETLILVNPIITVMSNKDSDSSTAGSPAADANCGQSTDAKNKFEIVEIKPDDKFYNHASEKVSDIIANENENSNDDHDNQDNHDACDDVSIAVVKNLSRKSSTRSDKTSASQHDAKRPPPYSSQAHSSTLSLVNQNNENNNDSSTSTANNKNSYATKQSNFDTKESQHPAQQQQKQTQQNSQTGNDVKKSREDFKCHYCFKKFSSKTSQRHHVEQCSRNIHTSNKASNNNTNNNITNNNISNNTNYNANVNQIYNTSNSTNNNANNNTNYSSATTNNSESIKPASVSDEAHTNRFLKYYQLANELSGRSNC